MSSRLLRLAALALATTTAATLVAQAPAVAGPKRIPDRIESASQSYLTDTFGRALNLRGFNLGDKYEWETLGQADFDNMASHGFNYARLLIRWTHLETSPGVYDAAYLDKIRTVLDYAHNAGVHVMLDMHQDVFGPAFGHEGIPSFYTRTDGLPFENQDNWFDEYFQPAVMRAFEHLYEDADLRQAQIDSWLAVVSAVRDHPAVLGYDLINEPFGELREGEDLVTASARIEQTQITPMYNRLADAIRTVDNDNWIFVEPTVLVGEGVPTQLGKIDDPKVAYAPHFYDTAVENGGDYDPNGPFVDNFEAAISAYPREHKLPVLVGEWGVPDPTNPSHATLLRRQTESMERWASGWAYYYWCKGGGYCAQNADGTLRPGITDLAQPYAQAIAGAPGQTHYDPVTKTYTVTYTPTSGLLGVVPTKITLPRALSANGWRVKASGSWLTSVVTAGDSAYVWALSAKPVTVTVTPR